MHRFRPSRKSVEQTAAELRWASLPYVLSGAALILVVWTR